MITFNRLRKNVGVRMKDVRVKTYTVMSFTFLAVIVLTVFAVRPVLFKLSDEIGQYNDLQTKDAALRSMLTNLSVAQGSYQTNVAGNTDVLNTALPTTPETGPLFANMQAIASPHNVEIDTISFTKEGQDTTQLDLGGRQVSDPIGTQALFFTLQGAAKSTDVAAYIHDLEQYPRIFNIVSISLSQGFSQAGQSTQTPQFSLTGYVFYLSNANS